MKLLLEYMTSRIARQLRLFLIYSMHLLSVKLADGRRMGGVRVMLMALLVVTCLKTGRRANTRLDRFYMQIITTASYKFAEAYQFLEYVVHTS